MVESYSDTSLPLRGTVAIGPLITTPTLLGDRDDPRGQGHTARTGSETMKTTWSVVMLTRDFDRSDRKSVITSTAPAR